MKTDLTTPQEKADFAAKQVVGALVGIADHGDAEQACKESYDDWYDMFYELFTDNINYEEYKKI